NISFDIHFHAVGYAGLVAAQIDKHAVRGLCERAIGRELKGADVSAARVVDVEDALVRREGKAVGNDEIVDQQGQGTEIGSHPADPGKGQIPLLRRAGARPRVGEIDAAVGFDDDVVRPVELAALKAVG